MELTDGRRWGERQFGRAWLSTRLRKRAVRMAQAAAARPGDSLPKMLGPRGQAKAGYRFMSNEEVTPEALLAGSFEASVDSCRGRSLVLCVQDGTYAEFNSRARARSGELGPIDNGGYVHGLVVHSALLVDGRGHEVLGLAHQHVWTREQLGITRGESTWRRRQRRRESEVWAATQVKVAGRMAALGEEAPHVVAVFDRGGDIFEAIAQTAELGQGFVIRASQDRVVESDDDEVRRLHEAAMAAPVLGWHEVQVPAKTTKKGRQPARRARLAVRCATVDLPPPKGLHGPHPPVCLNLVCALEESAPQGVEPLSWVLLTSLEAGTLQQAVQVLHCYEGRWIVEEFHMGLKTGCAIEARQLQSFHALANCIAFFSPLAVRLLQLRDAARRMEPAASVLGTTLMLVLQALLPEIRPDADARTALRAIASLGGFLGRKGDGEPGWRTIWSGFQRLLDTEQGWLLAKRSGQG